MPNRLQTRHHLRSHRLGELAPLPHPISIENQDNRHKPKNSSNPSAQARRRPIAQPRVHLARDEGKATPQSVAAETLRGDGRARVQAVVVGEVVEDRQQDEEDTHCCEGDCDAGHYPVDAGRCSPAEHEELRASVSFQAALTIILFAGDMDGLLRWEAASFLHSSSRALLRV
jgi:hypothetical protein